MTWFIAGYSLRKLLLFIFALAICGCTTRTAENFPPKEENKPANERTLSKEYSDPRKSENFSESRKIDPHLAQYIEEVRLKIERVGNVNYPEGAKGKIYGALILSVSINSDGRLEKVETLRSSGYQILDDAAHRVVMLAAPFSPFSPEMKRDIDVLVIDRKFEFKR